MDQEDVNRAELARRLGAKRQFITRVLNGTPNLTLLTLVKIATALNRQLKVDFALRDAPWKYDFSEEKSSDLSWQEAIEHQVVVPRVTEKVWLKELETVEEDASVIPAAA